MGLFSKKTSGVLLAPADGRFLPLESVPDEVFAQKVLGDGFAVSPRSGNVFSPASGRVETVSDIGHAVTIHTSDGLDVLVHVGVDTVNLGSAPFEKCVKEGDEVKAGTLLIRADIHAIKEANLPSDICVVITNREQLSSLLTEVGECIGGETVAATYRKN